MSTYHHGDRSHIKVESGEFLYTVSDDYKIVEPYPPAEITELALSWARLEMSLSKVARTLNCSPMACYGKMARALAKAIRSGKLQPRAGASLLPWDFID